MVDRRLLWTKRMVLLICCCLISCQRAHEFAGEKLPVPMPAPDRALLSADGPVSLQDFQGKYTFVYFGYRFCPDVCPVTMGRLKQVRADLGENADQMAVIMITVDPERDTPEKMAEFMNYFDSTFVGLSGDKEAIDAVGKPFGLYYNRHEGTEASGYLVDHTSRFFLLDRNGNVILSYAHETPTAALLKDVQYLIENE